jgi:hypothetical protein
MGPTCVETAVGEARCSQRERMRRSDDPSSLDGPNGNSVNALWLRKAGGLVIVISAQLGVRFAPRVQSVVHHQAVPKHLVVVGEVTRRA